MARGDLLTSLLMQQSNDIKDLSLTVGGIVSRLDYSQEMHRELFRRMDQSSGDIRDLSHRVTALERNPTPVTAPTIPAQPSGWKGDGKRLTQITTLITAVTEFARVTWPVILILGSLALRAGDHGDAAAWLSGFLPAK